MKNDYKEVNFAMHCPFCKFVELDDNMDPCNECLESPYNYQTDKPVRWTIEE